MPSAYPLLATILVLTTLVVGQAAPSGGDAKLSSPAAEPIPQILIGQPPDWKPLPVGCSPERVVGIVLGFADAINRGDRSRFTAIFRPDILDAAGTPGIGLDQPQPGWFSVEPGVPRRHGLWTRSRVDLAAWADKRHARGERWTVLRLFMGGYWWAGGVSIAFDVRRTADDLPARIVGGGGAVDCHHGTVFMWGIGGPPVLH